MNTTTSYIDIPNETTVRVRVLFGWLRLLLLTTVVQIGVKRMGNVGKDGEGGAMGDK
jgi:hypothetical protein